MTLFSSKAFGKFVLSLPAATLVEQWGSHVAKVGDKVFALYSEGGAAISFKVDEIAFEGLTGLDGIGQAPYFARRQWVQVIKGADLPDTDLRAYIAASHRTVAGKLTRKRRAELGIAEL